MIVLKIIIAIIIFSIIIIFHEFGHFLLAKLNDIQVNEFSLGFGPTIVSIQGKETKFSLKLLPFGGSCAMEGEDGDSDSKRAYSNKSVLARFCVVAAGPVFNFIMAFIFSVILIGSIGIDLPEISQVMDGYPAQEAGILENDKIIKLDNTKIYTFRDVSMYTFFHSGQKINVTYQRGDEIYNTVITPRYDKESDAYYIGLYGSSNRSKVGALSVIGYGIHEVKYWISYTIHSLFWLLTGRISLNDMSGPVGIIQTIGNTYEAGMQSGGLTLAVVNLLNISILLSANLGVVNLIPFPALDGGRLLFMIIEGIRRKKINPDKEGYVHFIGFVILLGFMAIVLFNDIRKLFLQ